MSPRRSASHMWLQGGPPMASRPPLTGGEEIIEEIVDARLGQNARLHATRCVPEEISHLWISTVGRKLYLTSQPVPTWPSVAVEHDRSRRVLDFTGLEIRTLLGQTGLYSRPRVGSVRVAIRVRRVEAEKRVIGVELWIAPAYLLEAVA